MDFEIHSRQRSTSLAQQNPLEVDFNDLSEQITEYKQSLGETLSQDHERMFHCLIFNIYFLEHPIPHHNQLQQMVGKLSWLA